VRRKHNATCQPLPFLSYREKGERQPSSGTRAGVGDSPRKQTGPVSVHPWQRAWFMARDPGLRGETGLRHHPGLILTPAVPHTWAPLARARFFFTVRLFDRRLWRTRPGTPTAGPVGRNLGVRECRARPGPPFSLNPVHVLAFFRNFYLFYFFILMCFLLLFLFYIIFYFMPSPVFIRIEQRNLWKEIKKFRKKENCANQPRFVFFIRDEQFCTSIRVKGVLLQLWSEPIKKEEWSLPWSRTDSRRIFFPFFPVSQCVLKVFPLSS
jgi:hypothetical protein